MLADISNFFLIFAVVSSFLALIFSLTRCFSINHFGYKSFFCNPSNYIILHSIAIIVSFLLLILAFCISDFSIKNVFLNSSSIMPLIFKISAAWASHEGSMLLWYSFVTLISWHLVLRKDEFQEYKTFILSIILFALSLFIYSTSNPFTRLYINPHEGVGLNPLLQDMALSIHPPILYLGYANYLGIFVYSAMSLLNPNLSIIYNNKALIYSKFGWIMVFLGITLGSSWAYRELGWGGYWFFDPVENISLIPLIFAIAYHHSLIFSLSKPLLMRWTLLFGINIFPFTLFGSFLLRSGLIISVHSFAYANNIEFLFLIFISIFCASNFLYIVMIRSDDSITPSSSNSIIKSKAQGILFANIIWIISVVVILFTLIFPIVLGFFGHNISVKEEYFYNYFLPLMIPLLFLAGTFAYFKHNAQSFTSYYATGFLSLVFAIITYYFLKLDGVFIFIALLASIFLIISTIVKFLEKTSYISALLSRKMTAMLLGHFGFGLLALSITLNSALQKEMDFLGKEQAMVCYEDYKVTLSKVSFGSSNNYYYQRAQFLIEDRDNKIIILNPENRLYKIENTLAAESDIFSDWIKDISIVLNKIDGEVIHAKIYYRPCMRILWLSAAMIFLAGIISLTSRRK